jgi:hypothetical protein
VGEKKGLVDWWRFPLSQGQCVTIMFYGERGQQVTDEDLVFLQEYVSIWQRAKALQGQPANETIDPT